MKLGWISLALLLALASLVHAGDLVPNGRGLRTKPLLGAMYDLELRVPDTLRGATAKTLIESDGPMEFVLTLQSGLINRKRFVEATTEGFEKAARSGYASAQTRDFLDQFASTEFRKGDAVLMSYADGTLTTTYRRAAAKDSPAADATLGRIPGPDIKKALFAIWLGEAPVQESLKNGLLGQP